MKDHMKGKLAQIVNNKLSSDQLKELEDFFRQAFSNSLDNDDEFFRNIAYDMTGELKELALLVIEFKNDMRSKIKPEIMDIATKYIPQATDQLEGIIETTEMAANKVMDNLETMQGHTEKMEEIISSIKDGEIRIPEGKNVRIDSHTIEAIFPLISYMESNANNYMSLISNSFVQMSFQDLTGQRIRRIMTLVSQMERKLKDMIIAFGIKLTKHEKNPDITTDELEKAVKEKVIELSGPQKAGQGLDQTDIDDLLAGLKNVRKKPQNDFLRIHRY